jgi:protein-tyrosine phosphatase
MRVKMNKKNLTFSSSFSVCIQIYFFFISSRNLMLGITEVIENLYISGLETNKSILNKGIRSVINISSECPMQDLGPTIDYEKISIPDLPTTSIQSYFDRLTDRIEQNLRERKKTLVHCYVGRSRSASIILG